MKIHRCQFFSNYRQEWFSNIRGDVLSGIVVALALIPEAIGFSVIAASILGRPLRFLRYRLRGGLCGRPTRHDLCRHSRDRCCHDLAGQWSTALQYLFAATILMGIFQIVAGWLRLGRVMRFVSRSVNYRASSTRLRS